MVVIEAGPLLGRGTPVSMAPAGKPTTLLTEADAVGRAVGDSGIFITSHCGAGRRGVRGEVARGEKRTAQGGASYW